VKFLCEQCKAKYQIADEKAAGKTVRMRCRKCGYLIEVRTAVTESSGVGVGAAAPEAKAHTSSPPLAASPAQTGTVPAAPRAAQNPAPPRAASPLATSLASAKPAPKAPERSTTGALAGAFKSTVQREEESSAPFDMADISPSDEWYVAINGVPVGPIRIGEVRRKAALGAVTEDSLCWQEGMDEWRALRSFPELVAIVREAFASGRSSLPPPPAGEAPRPSAPPPATRVAAKPASPAGPPRAAARATPPAPAARSNVVPITSRLATAEKLEEATDDMTRPYTGPPITPERPSREPAHAAREPSVVPDPFAAPPAPLALAGASAPAAIAPPGQPVMAQMALTPEVATAAAQAALPQRKQTNWAAIAMVAAAVAFGITTPIALFVGRAPAPAPVVVPVPATPAPTASAASVAPTTRPADSASPDSTTTSTPTPKGPVAMGGPPKPGATSNGNTDASPGGHGPLDLHGLTGNAVTPTDDQGGDNGSKAPGQCFSSGQVTQVIGLHQPGIRRACWERNPTTKPTVNVSVSLTIGPDGSPQAVSANADESSVAKCVENDVRSWRFPAMGCSQQTSFSFHFVRQ
jgi:predicted Zn finger-like uncharacterized protein